jgi:hypothetical protein
VRESATTGASIHRGIHRASNLPHVPRLSATYTPFSECFERRLTEVANQDNDTVMNTTGWRDKPYRWDQL